MLTRDHGSEGTAEHKEKPLPGRGGLEDLDEAEGFTGVLLVVENVDHLLILGQDDRVRHITVGVGLGDDLQGGFPAILEQQPPRGLGDERKDQDAHDAEADLQ